MCETAWDGTWDHTLSAHVHKGHIVQNCDRNGTEGRKDTLFKWRVEDERAGGQASANTTNFHHGAHVSGDGEADSTAHTTHIARRATSQSLSQEQLAVINDSSEDRFSVERKDAGCPGEARDVSDS